VYVKFFAAKSSDALSGAHITAFFHIKGDQLTPDFSRDLALSVWQKGSVYGKFTADFFSLYRNRSHGNIGILFGNNGYLLFIFLLVIFKYKEKSRCYGYDDQYGD